MYHLEFPNVLLSGSWGLHLCVHHNHITRQIFWNLVEWAHFQRLSERVTRVALVVAHSLHSNDPPAVGYFVRLCLYRLDPVFDYWNNCPLCTIWWFRSAAHNQQQPQQQQQNWWRKLNGLPPQLFGAVCRRFHYNRLFTCLSIVDVVRSFSLISCLLFTYGPAKSEFRFYCLVR